MYILLAFSIISLVCTLIIFCTCICMCKQINTAIHLVRLAAECLQDLPILLIYPIMNVCLAAAYLVLWTYVALYLAATGTVTTDATYGFASWAYDDETTYAFLYWLFGLLWVLEFSLAVGFTCVSFCFCVWFFTPEKEDGDRELPEKMMPKIICIVLSKFVGTLAFGSGIIAVIQMLRIIVEYVDHKKKEFEAAGIEPGVLWDYVFCCMRCCLWCLEKCMRWINKTVYIETILRNTWFCSGACQVVKVIVCYADYIAITKPIASGLLWFGKASMALGTAMICAYWTSTLNVASIFFPTVLSLIIGWFVADMFNEIFDMGIDTMLMCFCEAKFSGCDDSVLPNCFSNDKASDKDGNSMAQQLEKSKSNRESKASALEGAHAKTTV